jgi:hypothetical protein
MHEEPLSGGNATEGVMRVGDTVRKPWTPSSAVVQHLLARLAANGLDGRGLSVETSKAAKFWSTWSAPRRSTCQASA